MVDIIPETEVGNDDVIVPVISQDQMDLEHYTKQYDSLVKQKEFTDEMLTQTRGILVYLKTKLNIK